MKHKVSLKTIRCPKCKKGLLFDTTSKLSAAFSVLTYKCDVCGCIQSIKSKEIIK